MTRAPSASPAPVPVALGSRLGRLPAPAWATLLLAVHATLAVWGAARNSVTFDENFHLASGLAYVTRGDATVSEVNPPLVKGLCAVAALAAGARVPEDPRWRFGDAFSAGWSFQHANADRYSRVFLAARLVIVAFSCALGWLVYAFARSLYGERSALLALALFALVPESLAHAGLATMDVPTAFGWMLTVAAFWRFVTTGSWRWWGATSAAFGFLLLTRFTALGLPPVLVALAGLATWRKAAPRPGRLWLGLAALVPAALVVLWAGYLGRMPDRTLGGLPFVSSGFRALAAFLPGVRSPVPESWLMGLDHQALEGQQGMTPSYLLGVIRPGSTGDYYPIAIALKWPLGLLAAVGLGFLPSRPRPGRRPLDEAFLWLPAVAFLLGAVTATHLNVGVRYLLPMLPFACVLAARPLSEGLGARAPGRWHARLALACIALIGVETARVAPWYLTSFDLLAGPARLHDRLLNDSNVDWGQGLIALRDELRRRGIRRVYLAYHGTTDPALYGIDGVPWVGGAPGRESDWLAVSSYYRVGLSQRMVLPDGRTGRFVTIDCSPLDALEPVARPAGCMYLYRIR